MSEPSCWLEDSKTPDFHQLWSWKFENFCWHQAVDSVKRRFQEFILYLSSCQLKKCSLDSETQLYRMDLILKCRNNSICLLNKNEMLEISSCRSTCTLIDKVLAKSMMWIRCKTIHYHHFMILHVDRKILKHHTTRWIYKMLFSFVAKHCVVHGEVNLPFSLKINSNWTGARTLMTTKQSCAEIV